MAKNRLTQSERRWLTGFSAVVVVLASLYLVFAFARSSSVVVTQPGVEHPPSSRIDLYVYSLNVDPENNNLHVELFPVPRGAVGSALGLTGRASETFQLFVDGAEPPERTIEAGSVIERSDATIGVSDVTPIVNFPFDSYGGLIEASAKLKEPSATGSSNIPVIVHPEPPGVAGYNMLFSSPPGFSAPAALASGHWRTTLNVTRDDDVRLITILVGAILVCSALALLMVCTAIMSGRRKVSTDMLAWMAIFPFALITIRGVIPGAPPVGVNFDVVAYYWPVSVAFLTLIATVVRWLATRGAE